MAKDGKPQDQPQLGFPNIGEEDPNARGAATSDGQQVDGGGEGGGDKPTLEDLQRQLEALNASREQDKQAMESLRADKDRLLQGLLQTRDAGASHDQGGQGGQGEQPPPELNLDDMPDPVEKAAEFKTWFTGALKKAAQRPPQAAPQGQPANLSAVDQLWNEFLAREDNADLQENKRLALAIAHEEAGKMRQRGIDPARAVLMDPDGVFGRTAQATRKEIERIRGKAGDTDDDGGGDGNGGDRQPANRTGGVSGGSKPNGSGGRGAQPPVTSFVDELKREQVKSGFF